MMMNTANVVLRSGLTVARVCARAELSPDAMSLLADDGDVRGWVLKLLESGLYEDAVGFLAQVLPRREAVWWAWTCAGAVAGETPSPADAAVLEATRQWIIQPTDENRRAAMTMAEATDFETPAGIAGFAAFLCGDTIAPAEAPPAPPNRNAAARTITACINIAATVDPERVPDQFTAFLKKGLEMADKRHVWSAEPESQEA
jgi:hypothetical protein